MRHGFKAQAERTALAERKDLGLSARCRLDARELAAAKNIRVVELSELSGMQEDHRRHLLEVDTTAFSGVTVIRGDDKLIVVNDGHTAERQGNTVSHELAHVLLDHQPQPAFGEFGRTLSKEMEDEADWLAGCLLVPGSGIPATMRLHGGNLEAAAAHYGVSIELMRWRQNATRWKPRKKAA